MLKYFFLKERKNEKKLQIYFCVDSKNLFDPLIVVENKNKTIESDNLSKDSQRVHGI